MQESTIGVHTRPNAVADTNLSLDPAHVLLPTGETAQFTVDMQGSVAGPWTLAVSGLPQGVTGTFQPPTIAPGQAAILALTADPSAPDATSTVTVTAESNGYSVSAQGDLQVQSESSLGTGGGVEGAGGGTSDPCAAYADPSTHAPCTCSPGQACALNGCYGGWYCDLSTNKCVAPPSECMTGAGGGSGSGGGSAAGGGSSAGGGSANASDVGPTGGTVSLLHFAVTGDTRPPNCEDTSGYPSPVIQGIADAFQSKNAQFVVDLGDHMYVCNNSLSTAQAQMNLYMQAVHRFTGTWFMTMGNHECTSGPCLIGSSNANYKAFMSALAPISSKPYYSFNVHTSAGLATFVVIADNGWDSAQSSWLSTTLSQADTNAKYTFVFRHHPEGDTSVSTNPTSMALIRQHKFAMFITGHTHTYHHMTTDNGRDLVLGLGGAPLIAAGATYNGYAVIDQQASGNLQVTVYDVAGAVHDTWSVGPN
jgi:hypothetical protein